MKTHRIISNRRGQFVEIARIDLREIVRSAIYEGRPASCGRPGGRSLRAVIRRVRGVVFSEEARRVKRLREAEARAALRLLDERNAARRIAQGPGRKFRGTIAFLERHHPRSLRLWGRHGYPGSGIET